VNIVLSFIISALRANNRLGADGVDRPLGNPAFCFVGLPCPGRPIFFLYRAASGGADRGGGRLVLARVPWSSDFWFLSEETR